MKSLYSIFCISLLLFSCEKYEGPEKNIWIYPYKVNSDFSPDSGPGTLFQIQESEKLNYSKWIKKNENFEIKGFDFEEGYFYKLTVRAEKRNPTEKLVLKAIIEKRKDYISRIEGNWNYIPISGQPYIPINIRITKLSRSLHIISGGCSNGQTGLGEVGERKIQLAAFYGRLDINKTCIFINPYPEYNFNFVENTTEYQITPEGFLDFFDTQGYFLIRFKPSE